MFRSDGSASRRTQKTRWWWNRIPPGAAASAHTLVPRDSRTRTLLQVDGGRQERHIDSVAQNGSYSMRAVREGSANHRATGRPDLLHMRELRNPRSVLRMF